MSEKQYLTSKEVCRMCQFSTSVLNALEASGELKPRRKLPTTGKRLYHIEDVENYLSSISTGGKRA